MTAHAILAIVAVCVLLGALVIALVVRGQLYVGYGVVWLVVLATAILLTVVAPLTALVTRLTGAEYPASALTLAALAFIVLVLIYVSVQLTVLGARVTRIAQDLGTLRMELREAPSDDD